MNFLVTEACDVKEPIYSEEDLSLLDPSKIPSHVAIIMDGNRRWAKQRNLPIVVGHWKGSEALTKLVRAASELGIRALTVYGFSTENWRRDRDEVQALLQICKHYLRSQRDAMAQEGVRFDTIGDIRCLPEDLLDILEQCKEATKQSSRIDLILALNYGGRDDIRRAILAMMDDVERGCLEKAQLSEALFSRYLDTAKWEDPQLLIRTSGESRLSNFLLWQLSYSEIHIADTLWPDFTERELLRAVLDFQKRERRWGSG